MPKITDTEINIKLPGGTRGIKGHPGPVGPIGPQGEPGVQGNKGIVGPKGEVGEIPTFSIGSMTIGTPASITTTGTPENNILNMVIPKGQKGDAPDSPEISFSKSGKKTTMTVDIGETTKTYEMDDGVDPSVSVSKTGNDTTITTNMYGVSKSTVVPDGEHQFTAGEGISIENREVSDTNYDYIYGDATQEHSGTSFVIQKGLEAPIDSIELKGDTYQYTTTGKNLLTNTNGITQTINGLTFTKNSDGTVKVNGTSTANTNYYIDGNENNWATATSGTYYLSDSTPNPTNTTYFTYMDARHLDDSAWDAMYLNTSGQKTRTISDSFKFRGRIVVRSGVAMNNIVFKPMLEKSSTETSYEPYTNGASPNPDYPQNIEVVTGEQDISVVGKNLNKYPYKDTTYTSGSLTWTDNGDGTITVNGTNDTGSNKFFNLTSPSNWTPIVLEAGTYTASLGVASEIRAGIAEYTNNTSIANISSNTESVTFTLSQRTEVRFFLVLNNNKSVSNVVIKPMIEKGSTATNFEAYKGNTYEINLGKNLFDSSNWKQGDLTTWNASNRVTSTQALWLEPGTYTFSCNIASPYRYALQGQDVGKIPLSTYPTLIFNPGWKTSATPTYTFTLTQGLWFDVCMSTESNGDLTPEEIKDFHYQIEKGSVATSYSPYKTPIELCKIGNYQDKIFKDAKNKFNYEQNILDNTNFGSGTLLNDNTCTLSYVECEPNTTYTISRRAPMTQRFWVATTDTVPSVNVAISNVKQISNNTTTSITITTGANSHYIVMRFIQNKNDDYETYAKTIQVEFGGSETDYEEFGIQKWYVCKNIGKVVLNGSENWLTQQQTGFYRYGLTVSDMTFDSSLSNTVIIKSNNFRGITFNNRNSDLNDTIYTVTNNQQHQFFINTKKYSTVADFKTWLSTHNTTVYYVLNTPTYIGIEDEELISQLESIWTVDGINNINIATSYLPAYAKITSYNKNANGMLSSIIKMTEILEERSNN